MHGIRQNGKWNADFYSRIVNASAYFDFKEKMKNGQHFQLSVFFVDQTFIFLRLRKQASA